MPDGFGEPVAFKDGKGREFTVSACDAEFVANWPYSWLVDSNGYVTTTTYFGRTLQRHKLHRLILTGFAEIDHRDGNKANNCRDNLRPATTSQNQCNRVKTWAGTSRFKGVSRQPRTGRWESQIWACKKRFHIGTFATEEEAARAYDRAASELHGEFARLNFPQLRTA